MGLGLRLGLGLDPTPTPNPNQVASYLRERALLEQAHKELLSSHRPQQVRVRFSVRASVRARARVRVYP